MAQAEVAGIGSLSAVALLKRLRTSGSWLEWIARQLCQSLREGNRPPGALCPRAIDSTTIQGPGSTGIDWRLHYTLDLSTLQCDWHELTDASGSEALERAPLEPGDVLIGDRNFFRPLSVRSVVDRGGHVLLRLRWQHAPMTQEGKRFQVLEAADALRVGDVKGWPVLLHVDQKGNTVPGRVVAIRLPAPVARAAEKRARHKARRKKKKIDPRTIRAAHFVMIFTTLPVEQLDDTGVMELYRFRWQIEVAFKRWKQLLRLGQLPHKDQEVARSWILAKLVVALLLERLHRNAQSFFPWGFPIAKKNAVPATAGSAT